jgi:two-component system response regulator AtoC
LNWQTMSVAEAEPEDLRQNVMIPGVSSAISVLQRVLPEIASTDIPILILGETGTGKDIIAAEIHRLSPQRTQPFVKLSCSSINLDSMLAARGRHATDGNGMPHEGTILLDEVSGLSFEQQTRLLNLLPDNGKAGANSLRSRLISTSMKDLTPAMRSGNFREELYFRLNGFCLRIPSLRQRKEDIPLLFATFVNKYAKWLGRQQPNVKDSTIDLLIEYSWPGNVRELENFARKIVLFGDDQRAINELAANGGTNDADESLSNGHATDSFSLKQAAREASRKVERKMILESLERTHWNRKRSARELQISYKALLYKLKQLGLGDKRGSER